MATDDATIIRISCRVAPVGVNTNRKKSRLDTAETDPWIGRSDACPARRPGELLIGDCQGPAGWIERLRCVINIVARIGERYVDIGLLDPAACPPELVAIPDLQIIEIVGASQVDLDLLTRGQTLVGEPAILPQVVVQFVRKALSSRTRWPHTSNRRLPRAFCCLRPTAPRR